MSLRKTWPFATIGVVLSCYALYVEHKVARHHVRSARDGRTFDVLENIVGDDAIPLGLNGFRPVRCLGRAHGGLVSFTWLD